MMTIYNCELESEACGICLDCLTRTMPGTSFLWRAVSCEDQLLSAVQPPIVPTYKGMKVRGRAKMLWDIKFHVVASSSPYDEKIRNNPQLPVCELEVQTSINDHEEDILRGIFEASTRTRNASLSEQFAYLHEYVCGHPTLRSAGTKSLIGKYLNLGTIDDALVDLVESFVLFYFMMFRARCATDRIVALTVIAKLLNEKVSTLGLTLVSIQALFEQFCGTDSELDVQSGTLPDFDSLRSFLEKYDQIKRSPLYAKLYKFSMYGLSLALFKPVGITLDSLKFDKIAREAIKREYHMGPDFIHCLLDTMLFLCERGYQSYMAGTIMPMFHSESKYQEWFDEAQKLIRQANFLSNPDVHGIDRFAFLADLKDVIERGKCMKKCATKNDEKIMIGRILATLELTHDLELTKRAAQKDRKTPLCLLLFGGSGIGKSTLENVLFQHYGKRRGLKTTSDFRYVRNPTEEYWSGMNSTQWCIVLDDIGFLAPSLGTMDPSLAEMLCIANNVPFVPAQAELSDKGRTPVRAELVLGSTNTETLNLSAYFSCPLAVQRRFPWVIDVKVKHEYEHDDRPGMLDSSKVPTPRVGTYPDLWEFVIKRVEPVGEERNGQRGRNVVVEEFDSMAQFLKWYNKVIDEHNTIQDIIMAGNDVMEETTLCGTCGMPNDWCECLHTQSGEIELYVPQYVTYEPISFETYVHSQTFWVRCIVYTYYVLYWLNTCPVVSTLLRWLFGKFWFLNMMYASPHKMLLMRAFCGYAGYRIQHKFGNMHYLCKLTLGVSALLAMYKAGSILCGLLKKDRVQGGSSSKVFVDNGVRPVPDVFQRHTPTYEDPFPFNCDDLSQATLTQATADLLLRHVERATCSIQTSKDGIVRTGIAVVVRGCVYMTNNHSVPTECPFYIDVTCAAQGNMGTSMKQILVTDTMVHRIVEHDLAFIRLSNRPPGTNLTKYMPNKSFTGKLDAMYVGRSIIGVSWRKHVPVVVPEIKTWKSHDLYVTQRVWMGKVEVPTVAGDCGAFLVSNSPAGPVILGIHTLGRDNVCGAMFVCKDVVVEACDLLEKHFISRGKVSLTTPTVTKVLGPLDSQSCIRRANRGVADVIGSFTGDFRMRGRTNVIETLIAPHLASFGYCVNRVAPDMSKKPWVNALNDTTRPVVDLNSDILSASVDMYKSEVSQCDVSRVHVYPLDVAINGMPGLRYCDKMNRKTSAGFPYKVSKARFLYYVDEIMSTDVDVVDEIKYVMTDIVETYKRGERYHPVFCGHLKDEPVTQEKLDCGKTRVFTASGMAFTLVVRKYLLSVIVHIQNNRYVFESGPGVVAQSLEWEQIREHVTKFGEDRIVAGDYSKFDKRMPANVILAAFDVIVDICVRAGYTDEDLAVVRGIAYDTAFPNVDFNGDLVEFYGSNPSGHPLTVIVNGLVNSLYMRYCFMVLRPVGVTATFKETVALMTYGDDNIMGVCESAPWFNHTAIQQTLASVDIGYTMADKEAESQPYINISEANFLKRIWRWDSEVGAYVAPLDRSSIEKMLTVCVRKKNVSAQSHAISVISTALREYFFYGREEFEQKVCIMRQVVDKANLELYVEDSTFPSWDELYQHFWENSEGVVINRLQ